MTNGPVAPERRIFVNRTLNMRSIRAIGYDMDYTLIHYRVDEWERLAYDHARRNLAALGWPVEALVFDAGEVIRGLALDLELGNPDAPPLVGNFAEWQRKLGLRFDEMTGTIDLG